MNDLIEGLEVETYCEYTIDCCNIDFRSDIDTVRGRY
jgi:hypothetical protein